EHYGRRGSLRQGLVLLDWSLQTTGMLLETCCDRTWMKRVGANAIARPAMRNANSEQRVGGLGLSIGDDRRVGNEIKAEVIEYNRREQVPGGAHGHDSGALCCRQCSIQAGGQCKV